MKTNETSTLYTTMSNNIGQVKKENAQKEIERLNKQDNTKSWRIDESTFMFVEDETDEYVHNPCEKIEGYVWITCEPMSTREQAILWWDTLPVWGNPSKEYYMGLYYSDDNVTPERIEEIWKKETKQIGFIGGESLATSVGLQPNQKQFKEANESLMSAYLDKFDDEGRMKFFKVLIDKFSDEDKVKAHQILFKSFDYLTKTKIIETLVN